MLLKKLLNIQDVLSEEYFDNQAHKWVIKEILKYYQKYHTCPTMDVLKVELKKIDNEVLQVSIKEQLREAYKSSPIEKLIIINPTVDVGNEDKLGHLPGDLMEKIEVHNGFIKY